MKEQIIRITDFSKDEFILLLREAFPSGLATITPPPQSPTDDILTREQASKMLNASFTTLYLWNKEGKLKARKMGRKVYYLRQDVMNKLNDAA